MSNPLPVKKIYIDSKFKTLDSVSNTNFKFQLPRNLTLPGNSTFYIDDVAIPHSWWSIEFNVNDRLFIEWFPLGPLGASVPMSARLFPGNYNGTTFASMLQLILINSTGEAALTCTYSVQQNNIRIRSNSNGAFFFPTDFVLKTVAKWASFSSRLFASCNDILGNTEAAIPAATDQYTNNLSLANIRNIFISSSTLGCFSAVGPSGESNIIKKVAVNADFGSMIIDTFTTDNDFISCDKQTLNVLEFTIHDEKGNPIPLHGGHVSFSIVFSAHNKDIL